MNRREFIEKTGIGLGAAIITPAGLPTFEPGLPGKSLQRFRIKISRESLGKFQELGSMTYFFPNAKDLEEFNYLRRKKWRFCNLNGSFNFHVYVDRQ